MKNTLQYKNNDVHLLSFVKDALKWHNSVREKKVRTKIKNGWLTLEGEVDWEFQKNAAQIMVDSISHLRGITNNIKVVPERAELKTRQVFNCFSL